MTHRWRREAWGIGRPIALLLFTLVLRADTQGYIEQKFSYLTFERNKWDRTAQLPCYIYSAKQDGAVVEILRIGGSNLVPFKASKGLAVKVCGDSAAFDEGFEAGAPIVNKEAATK